ncbi:Ribosomal large subunit pseudouridine synthase C (23S rRNA pseudouridine(955/2504/2580) synthase) (rRNA pseudouridylate synthase C) (rRNA-uridine isomerase C) [Durusdinium trenchii]
MERELREFLHLKKPSKAAIQKALPGLQQWGPSKVTLVLRKLGTEHRGHLLLPLMDTMRQSQLELDVFHYSAAAAAAASETARWHLPLHLLGDARRQGIRPNEYTYCSTMSAPWYFVIETVRQMQDFRLTNQVSCSSAISAFGQAGEWRFAIDALGDAAEHRLGANAFSLSAAMASCDNLHQWRRALEALETLQSADLRLDTDSDDFAPCCDLAISACAKGSNWQGALEMLTKMKGCSMRTGDVTYSAAITACSNTEEWRVAMALCGELMMCHLEPGIWCTASAHACDKVGAWLQALSIFEWVSDRTEVDGALAGSVLSSLSSSKGASCALELLRCLGRQWQPAVPEVEVEAGSAGVLCHRPGIVVVNKASGESTESLLLRCSKSFGIQLRLASRLDAPTSGVLPLACGESAGKYLQAQFAGRLVRKDYICLCAGPSLGEMHSSAVISQPLLTTGQDGINSRTIVSKIGRPAKTAYVVQARYWHSAPPVEEQELILLRVRPLTGRTHQIRVHLASIGRPILGDMVYGTPAVGHACFRLFLHCAKLRLFDFTGSTFTAEAPLPA